MVEQVPHVFYEACAMMWPNRRAHGRGGPIRYPIIEFGYIFIFLCPMVYQPCLQTNGDTPTPEGAVESGDAEEGLQSGIGSWLSVCYCIFWFI